MVFLKKLIRPLLAIILISILLIKGPFDFNQLKTTLANGKLIALGLGLILLQNLLFTLRWQLFIKLQTPIQYQQILKLNFVGLFFNYFIPGGVGGDLVKALELSKSTTLTRSETLSTVMSDRVFGLFAMISFTLVFLSADYLLYDNAQIIRFVFLSLFLFIGITTTLLFFPLIFKKISEKLANKNNIIVLKIEKLVLSLNKTFLNFRNIKVQLISFFLSLIGQLLAVYFMFSVVQSLTAETPSFLIFFSLCCFSFVASAIPLFPAGIGVGQAAIYALFLTINEDTAKASIVAITCLQLFQFVYALLGGILFSFTTQTKLQDAIES